MEVWHVKPVPSTNEPHAVEDIYYFGKDCHKKKLKLSVGTIFNKMNESDWLEKNLLLDKGFDNSGDIICGLSKANDGGRHLACNFLQIFYKMERYLSNLPTARWHYKTFANGEFLSIIILFQLLECSFSHKAKIKCFKELLMAQTHHPRNHAFINPEKRWSHR